MAEIRIEAKHVGKQPHVETGDSYGGGQTANPGQADVAYTDHEGDLFIGMIEFRDLVVF